MKLQRNTLAATVFSRNSQLEKLVHCAETPVPFPVKRHVVKVEPAKLVIPAPAELPLNSQSRKVPLPAAPVPFEKNWHEVKLAAGPEGATDTPVPFETKTHEVKLAAGPD